MQANLYVANYGNAVTVYAAGAKGNVAPTRTIAGSQTKLDGADGIAVDASGNIHVADYRSNAVVVFAAGSNGDVSPARTIKGPDTKLSGPEGIAIR